MSDIMQGRDANVEFCPTAATITNSSSTAYATGVAYSMGAIVSNGGHYYRAKVAVATGDNTSSSILSNASMFDDLGTTISSSITAPTGTVACLSNANSWDLTKDTEVKDYAVFNNGGYKKKSTGLQTWSSSVKAYFDDSDTNGQLALITAFDAGKKTYFKLDINDTHYWHGNAFIKSLKTAAAADGEVSFDIELEGDSMLFYV